MTNKSLFCISSGAILAITGSAKIWSSFGSAGILKNADPFLGLPFGYLMFAIGVLELAIAGACLFKTEHHAIVITLIAWLSTTLLLYRLGLWWKGWRHPCSCLGNLTDAIHVPPQVADNVMKCVLAYLLIGSYASLFCLWRQQKTTSNTSPHLT